MSILLITTTTFARKYMRELLFSLIFYHNQLVLEFQYNKLLFLINIIQFQLLMYYSRSNNCSQQYSLSQNESLYIGCFLNLSPKKDSLFDQDQSIGLNMIGETPMVNPPLSPRQVIESPRQEILISHQATNITSFGQLQSNKKKKSIKKGKKKAYKTCIHSFTNWVLENLDKSGQYFSEQLDHFLEKYRKQPEKTNIPELAELLFRPEISKTIAKLLISKKLIRDFQNGRVTKQNKKRFIQKLVFLKLGFVRRNLSRLA